MSNFNQSNITRCLVDLTTQTMLVLYNNQNTKIYDVSTAIVGANNLINSYGTPLGKHIICEKIGEHVPIGTIFRSRINTGEICENLNDPNIVEDLILTRILRLKGKELGINLGFKGNACVDSHSRSIYIHGTNREDLIGTPSSKGCIRMKNLDLIELFNNVDLSTEVEIYTDLREQDIIKVLTGNN